jgi:hypothetical protein
MSSGVHVEYPLLSLFKMKLEFSLRIFEKFSNIKFHEKKILREPNCSTRAKGQMDRHDEANSSFLQFCERA